MQTEEQTRRLEREWGVRLGQVVRIDTYDGSLYGTVVGLDNDWTDSVEIEDRHGYSDLYSLDSIAAVLLPHVSVEQAQAQERRIMNPQAYTPIANFDGTVEPF